MKPNLVYKLFAGYLFLALVAIIVVHLYLGGHIRSHLGESIEENLFTYAELMQVTTSFEEMESVARSIAGTTNTRVTLVDRKGRVLTDTEFDPVDMENHFNRPEIQEARIRGSGKDIRKSITLGIDTLYVAMAVMDEQEKVGYIRLARPLTDVRDSMGALNMALLQSFLLIGILAFLVAYLFSTRLVSPIQEMEQFTQKLQRGEYPGTLLISAADERGRLARNINYLVNELRDKIRLAEEEKAKLEAAFEAMNDGVLILNAEGVIERCNRAFENIFNRSLDDIADSTLLDAFRNVDLQEALDTFTRTGDTMVREIVLGDRDPRAMEVTFCSIQRQSNDGSKTMVVFHDVTRLKKLEKVRVDFVANVTHEIRTPLAAIMGAIESLQMGALDDRTTALTFLDTMKRQSERLNRLVDDLFTISDIELGELPLTLEPLSLEPVLSGLWPLIEDLASKKDITLLQTIPGELPRIRADRDRMVQILLNVLDNAVKYTDSGGTVELRAETPTGDRLQVIISDTGIGIPPKDLERLGERFFRVDRARSRQSGGTGLGLSIVKHLMSAHGGTMKIASKPGRGTEVSLTFPLAG